MLNERINELKIELDMLYATIPTNYGKHPTPLQQLLTEKETELYRLEHYKTEKLNESL
jgi:hypothetical protein